MSHVPTDERLRSAVQALFQSHAMEGPPGDGGQRSVWHLSPLGAELLTLVDASGQVQRQELTLLEDHCMWASGKGLSTGRVERAAPSSSADTSVVHADERPMPTRLLRAALALEGYRGQDRYILHMQRVLALARQSLVLSGGQAPVVAPAAAPVAAPPSAPSPQAPAPPAPPAPVAHSAPAAPPAPAPDTSQAAALTPRREHEGMLMLVVMALGIVVGLVLLALLV